MSNGSFALNNIGFYFNACLMFRESHDSNVTHEKYDISADYCADILAKQTRCKRQKSKDIVS